MGVFYTNMHSLFSVLFCADVLRSTTRRYLATATCGYAVLQISIVSKMSVSVFVSVISQNRTDKRECVFIQKIFHIAFFQLDCALFSVCCFLCEYSIKQYTQVYAHISYLFRIQKFTCIKCKYSLILNTQKITHTRIERLRCT